MNNGGGDLKMRLITSAFLRHVHRIIYVYIIYMYVHVYIYICIYIPLFGGSDMTVTVVI